MNSKCKNCLWYYEDSDCCVSESMDTFDNPTFQTESCVGFLRKDYEEHMLVLKKALIELFKENENLSDFIKNMSYNAILTVWEKVINDIVKAKDGE